MWFYVTWCGNGYILKVIQNGNSTINHGFQNRTGPGGRIMKTGNQDENRFFKPKEPDFLLIPWIAETGVEPHEPVRTVWSNPLAIFFFKNNFTQFYST